MATPTVLRVKRRLEDNPQDALVLLCKRMKTDEEEISPSLFVFRGTVHNQETSEVKTVVPKPVKLKSASNINEIIQKIRQEKKESAAEKRYKIVNCSRGIRENSCTEGDDLFDLVDLHPTSDDTADVKYIYDLYTPAKEDFDISMLDNLISIENYETDLVLGTYQGNGQPGSEEEQEDEDDSNDEDNWRNEYPDSEPSSIDEDDMVKAMQNCDLDDLSSDTGEDKIYDEPPALFNKDAELYGQAYAKYKAKVQSEDPSLTNSNSFVHCSKIKDLDEETIEGYKDDSDDGFYYGQEENSEQFKEQYEEHNSSDEYSPD